MTARVFVDGGFEGTDKDALFDPAAKMIFVDPDDVEVGLSKVVIVIARVLHNGRLALTGAP